ncbi:MAG: hypothetical protein EHM58_19370 [Ignavibacteriae bacterium]|nr:MAG: hypothetical protein EHM58_19370 [Ignavibacteriota bacterium]
MKKNKTQLINLLILILIAFTIPACPLLGDIMGSYGDEYFRVQIDSVSVPASITLNDNLEVRLWGVVGKDSCYSFSHFQSSVKDNDLNLTAWGYLRDTYRVSCAQGNVLLDGKIYNVTPQNRGIFRINIHQPDGTVVSKEVNVN